VQHEALTELARLERGAQNDDGAAHPRLTRLEGGRSVRSSPRPSAAGTAARLEALSPKQHELLRAVATAASVSEAADQLSVSRSNVYASLRRIARKLDVRSVSDLVHLARAGELG
jgi:DNA-binding CsgD family transcriptional regulator